MQRLTPHVVYTLPDSRTDRPSLAAVTGTRGTLMLDIGNSVAHTTGFLQALAEAGLPAPRYAAITHAHWDHFFGAAALDIPLIAHQETARLIAIQAGYDWSDEALDQRVVDGLEIDFCRTMIKVELPDRNDVKIIVPDIQFSTSMTIDLGGVTCQLYHVGGDHAADSVVMVVPEDKVMFVGDALYDNLHAPKRHYTPAKSRALLDRLEAFDIDHYILGHHPAAMPRDEIRGWMSNLRLVGTLLEKHGNNRDAIVNEFKASVSRDLTEDDFEDIDTFLAGLD